MGIVKAALTRITGLMKESDGKVLQDPDLRAEGRRLQEDGRAEATAERERRERKRHPR
ncbi:hypothetical protein ACIOMM_09175 [Streptomyces sp. NPDC087908]|uniref:hypothetical protein n=1 Tax=unclassified Streptomyces TaxID=2593676 RepID=UPI00165092AF|nr:hypothetical protein [Streptomyces sp. adm13(2018)]